LTYRAEPIWKGETCYIIGGGPSVTSQPIHLLKGKKIIVINSSYIAFPEAQFCVFSDMRWWCEHIRCGARNFKGTIISTSASASGAPNLVIMRRSNIRGLNEDRETLMIKNTTLTAAINLAYHFAVAKIVLLGIDQKKAADGRTHHHRPHPWQCAPDCFPRQQSDLPPIAEGLRGKSIECVNASPGSALALWPIVELRDHVEPADQCLGAAGIGGQHLSAGVCEAAGAQVGSLA
jgi:hypothetical protein